MTVDLHLHTTASDGRCTPRELVSRAASAGVAVLAVTDHDTTAAVAEVTALARARGIDAITGIEITAVEAGRDVHILGYFIDVDHPPLARFLERQRDERVARIGAMGDRLARLGMPIDLSLMRARARDEGGSSIGRPHLARAMIASGHVADTREAFDRWLATGRPAFVPRTGASLEEVLAAIRDAGGLTALAHPGLTAIDARIPVLRLAGLDAIEVYHPNHDAAATERYRQLASRLDLLVTGGSDFHGDPAHGLEPGSVTLPADAWLRLRAAAPHG